MKMGRKLKINWLPSSAKLIRLPFSLLLLSPLLLPSDGFAFSFPVTRRVGGNGGVGDAIITQARWMGGKMSPSSSSAIHEKPGWLDDAMEGFNMKQDDGDDNNRLTKILPMMSSQGLAGFAVDPEMGFCAILTVSKSNDDDDDANKYILPVVVSSTDKSTLTSAEALTMVQLAGGLDLGTAILPPDLLKRLVADELLDDDDNDVDEDTRRNELRQQVVTLTKIDVILNNDVATESSSCSKSISPTTESSSSPERDVAIQSSLTKVWTAVKGLPGLSSVTESQIETAMKIFANSDGQVDRDAFSNILDYIRRDLSPKEQSQVSFRLLSNVISGDSIQQVTLETTNAVHAIGLSLRYKVELDVVMDDDAGIIDFYDKDDDSSLMSPIETILERYPAFRPMTELLEDAQIMDGFIPSMLQQAKIDNDMKE